MFSVSFSLVTDNSKFLINFSSDMWSGFFKVKNRRMSNSLGYNESRFTPYPRIWMWTNSRVMLKEQWAVLELTDAFFWTIFFTMSRFCSHADSVIAGRLQQREDLQASSNDSTQSDLFERFVCIYHSCFLYVFDRFSNNRVVTCSI